MDTLNSADAMKAAGFIVPMLEKDIPVVFGRQNYGNKEEFYNEDDIYEQLSHSDGKKGIKDYPYHMNAHMVTITELHIEDKNQLKVVYSTWGKRCKHDFKDLVTGAYCALRAYEFESENKTSSKKNGIQELNTTLREVSPKTL